MMWPLTTAGVLAALAVYIWAIYRVGQARGKSGIDAPAMTGDPAFERAVRAQANTVEQLVLFLPLVAIAGFVWGDRIAGAFAVIWSIGRLLYIEGYIREAAKRSLGFLLSGVLSLVVLIALVVTLVLRATGVV